MKTSPNYLWIAMTWPSGRMQSYWKRNSEEARRIAVSLFYLLLLGLSSIDVGATGPMRMNEKVWRSVFWYALVHVAFKIGYRWCHILESIIWKNCNGTKLQKEKKIILNMKRIILTDPFKKKSSGKCKELACSISFGWKLGCVGELFAFFQISKLGMCKLKRMVACFHYCPLIIENGSLRVVWKSGKV